MFAPFFSMIPNPVTRKPGSMPSILRAGPAIAPHYTFACAARSASTCPTRRRRSTRCCNCGCRPRLGYGPLLGRCRLQHAVRGEDLLSALDLWRQTGDADQARVAAGKTERSRMHAHGDQGADGAAIARDGPAARIPGRRGALSEHVVGAGHARRDRAAGRNGAARRDAVTEPLERHRLGECGPVVVDRGGPSEVAHAGARLGLRIEADQGEVLGILLDRVGELAHPFARGVTRHRPRARGPRFLADVAADRARAEDAMAGGADITAAVRSLEEKIQRA